MMNNKNVIIGIFAGMTGGILIGMGITSKKGLAVRKQLMDKGDEYLGLILDKLTLISSTSPQSPKDNRKETKV